MPDAVNHDERDVRAPALTPLELASGVALGAVPDEAGPTALAWPTARRALEAVIARELEREPCIVSFSGGRDSSAVLALATHVAKREGLSPPRPVTLRFPGVAETEESEWQEHVITHLGLTEWERIELTTELDLLGDIGRAGLRHHGIMWPANAFIHVPIFRVARHGSVLTGLDGDGLFGDWTWGYAQAILHRKVPFALRDIARAGLALAPPAVRAQAMRRRPMLAPGWLLPASRRDYLHAVVARAASEPRRWDRRVRWHARSRALMLAQRNLALLGATENVHVAHPFLHPEVLAALATEGGAAGYGDRTTVMRHLVGDLLPVETIGRRTKAVFGRALWGPQTIEFAQEWEGAGVDTNLVDPEILRAAWVSDYPPFQSWILLQSAWLAGS